MNLELPSEFLFLICIKYLPLMWCCIHSIDVCFKKSIYRIVPVYSIPTFPPWLVTIKVAVSWPSTGDTARVWCSHLLQLQGLVPGVGLPRPLGPRRRRHLCWNMINMSTADYYHQCGGDFQKYVQKTGKAQEVVFFHYEINVHRYSQYFKHICNGLNI